MAVVENSYDEFVKHRIQTSSPARSEEVGVLRYTYIVSRTVNYYTYTSRVGNICLHFESQLFVYTSVLTSS